MIRVFLAAAAMAALSLSAAAGETSVHLTVRPMEGPRPALKYQLLPELSELNPGNAAQNYLKCFMEQHPFFFSKQGVDERNRYRTMPLADLAMEKLGNYGGSALRQADWAARMDTIDWQSLASIQSGGIEILPAEVGPLQVLAKALHVRFRAEIAEQHFDDAIRSAKTMFALARHLGEYPSEVANLVGLWVAHLGLNSLEEMVQQPGCPNLFWALTDLPVPLVDLRKGVQGERTLVAAELRAIRDDAPMTEAELDKFVSRLSGLMSFAREQSGRHPLAVRERLRASAKDAHAIDLARRRLVESGLKKAQVNEFTSLHLILLDEKRAYEIERDERLKLLALPLWQIECLARDGEQHRGSEGIFADLLPNTLKLRREQAGLEQQVALLRHVEACRMYAAQNGGKLAARLADIPLPLPLDPVTGKPFVYLVEGTTAKFSGSAPPGERGNAAPSVHYVVTIRK